MASDGSGLNKAIQLVKKGAEFDGDGNYPDAIKFYMQGLDWFQHVMKYEKNPRTQVRQRFLTTHPERARSPPNHRTRPMCRARTARRLEGRPRHARTPDFAPTRLDHALQEMVKLKMGQYMDRVEVLKNNANGSSGQASNGSAQARKPKPTDDGKSGARRPRSRFEPSRPSLAVCSPLRRCGSAAQPTRWRKRRWCAPTRAGAPAKTAPAKTARPHRRTRAPPHPRPCSAAAAKNDGRVDPGRGSGHQLGRSRRAGGRQGGAEGGRHHASHVPTGNKPLPPRRTAQPALAPAPPRPVAPSPVALSPVALALSRSSSAASVSRGVASCSMGHLGRARCVGPPHPPPPLGGFGRLAGRAPN
eukprot:SAG11_NODE_65_length_18798_cov_11.881224_3_plen_359_part_00